MVQTAASTNNAVGEITMKHHRHDIIFSPHSASTQIAASMGHFEHACPAENEAPSSALFAGKHKQVLYFTMNTNLKLSCFK